MTPTISPTRCDSDEFAVALKNISKARPRVNVDAWTEHDAAKYWYPDYDPDKPTALPPQLILGIVARIFVNLYHRVAPIGKFFEAAIGHSGLHFPSGQGGCAIRFNEVCKWAYIGYQVPVGDWEEERCTSSSYLNRIQRSCNRKTCKEGYNSYALSCIPASAATRLEAAGYLVPWSYVKWSGLSALLTPMRYATDTPYLYIQRERSHVKKPLVPYFVDDALRNLHRIVPELMQSTEFRQAVHNTKTLRGYVAALETERLRYVGVVTMHPDCDALLNKWDAAFATSCWMFGNREKVYSALPAAYWGVDSEAWDKLDDTQPDDLFPKMPSVDDATDDDD